MHNYSIRFLTVKTWYSNIKVKSEQLHRNEPENCYAYSENSKQANRIMKSQEGHGYFEIVATIACCDSNYFVCEIVCLFVAWTHTQTDTYIHQEKRSTKAMK